MSEVYDKQFWDMLDRVVNENDIVIDRKKDSTHPKYPNMIYPVDYGYLEGTSSMDGGGIDIWMGTDKGRKLSAIICTVDIMKKDSEIKLIIGCSEGEKDAAYRFHNEGPFMKGILIERR